MKKTVLLLLLSLFTNLQLYAQITKPDSVALKLKTAVPDAKHFKLDKQIWKVYRKHGVNYTSDYFKPTTINTIHIDFLTDSVYVKAFREAAYKKTVRRSIIRHYIITEAKNEVISTIGIAAILYLIVYAITSGYK